MHWQCDFLIHIRCTKNHLNWKMERHEACNFRKVISQSVAMLKHVNFRCVLAMLLSHTGIWRTKFRWQDLCMNSLFQYRGLAFPIQCLTFLNGMQVQLFAVPDFNRVSMRGSLLDHLACSSQKSLFVLKICLFRFNILSLNTINVGFGKFGLSSKTFRSLAAANICVVYCQLWFGYGQFKEPTIMNVAWWNFLI